MPQPPQLAGSLLVFAQYGATEPPSPPPVPESTGAGAPVSDAPLASSPAEPSSAAPESLLDAASGAPASAEPPHRVSPDAQPAPHAPAEQTCVEEHTWPHMPQFLGSVLVLVQVPPHFTLPALQPVVPSPEASPTASLVASELPPSSPLVAEEPPPVAQPPPPNTRPRTSANTPARSERCWFIEPQWRLCLARHHEARSMVAVGPGARR
jgi:hypothetical protein